MNAERALEAAFSDEYAHYPEEQRKLWAAAAVLQCDVLRYLVTFQNATREGVVRLLWIGDIVSMLYEAKNWLSRTGTPTLRCIAESKGYAMNQLQARLRDMKKNYPLGGIDAFADYRNKVGYHYDPDFVTQLRRFSEIRWLRFSCASPQLRRFHQRVVCTLQRSTHFFRTRDLTIRPADAASRRSLTQASGLTRKLIYGLSTAPHTRASNCTLLSVALTLAQVEPLYLVDYLAWLLACVL